MARQAVQQKEIFLLLHDIRSVHNVGSIFRTADAAGVTKIYITGYTPTPLDRFGRVRTDLSKASLGAEKTIPWEYAKTATKIISDLHKKGIQVIAIEQNKKSLDYKKIKITYPTLFIVGNEVKGISKNILKKCDLISEIPMKGKKESLNVGVSFGIALFRMLNI